MQGNILVTGSSGFIGEYLLEKLLATDCRVYCLVRQETRRQKIDKNNLVYINADITNAESLEKISIDFDYVFHLAGHLSGGSTKTFERVNVFGVRNLYERLLQLEHIPKRIIHVSSMAAGGPSVGYEPRREDQKEEPISVYGRTKLAGEKIAREYMNRMPVTVVRPSVVYGPNDRNALSIYKMVDKNIILVPPKQPKLFSMVHASDLVTIMQKLAISNEATGNIYNIATGTPIAWQDFIGILAKVIDRKPRSIVTGELPFRFVAFFNLLRGYLFSGKTDILTPQKLPELFAQYWTVNTDKLKQTIGDIKSIDIVDGIKDTADWYKASGWI